MLKHTSEQYNAGLDLLEKKGYFAAQNYYKALRGIQEQNISKLNSELNELQSAMDAAMNSGEIEKGSESWYEMVGKIHEVENAINDAKSEIVDLNNSMRQLRWDQFDYLQDRIARVTGEADFLIGLLDNSELYKDSGDFNEGGTAVAGLHAENYNVYMAQADKYASELKALNKELANDPNNKTLIERWEAITDAQREAINSAEEEKEAIKGLVKDGIEKELAALQKLIDQYNKEMDAAKDLYEFQKKTKDQTAEIAKLEKQLAAYKGDNSEETRTTVQKLRKQLGDAQQNLQDSQYDRYVSDQKTMLDDLYNEYSDLLNSRLDDTNALMKDMIDTVNASGSDIYRAITDMADSVGYSVSKFTDDIWTSATAHSDSIVEMYGDNFTSQLTSVNYVLNDIRNFVAAMSQNGEDIAGSDVASIQAGRRYAKGGLVNYTGPAWVDGSPSHPELVLNAQDTENFIALKDMLGVIKHRQPLTGNSPGMAGSVGAVNIDIAIDRVQDYNDFVEQLKTDNRVERLIQAVSIDRLAGKSSLAKNSIRWK